MKITREDLKKMYLEHMEAERIRLAKMIEEEFKTIVQELLNENLSGRFLYQRKCYEYSETYLNSLLTRLQSVFVDSKIQTAFITDDGPQKYVLVKIEWA
uniref:Uncharacterized protein n=1 Tax=viral metagenome TaxID=1070528 RepID=A0A6C0L907_9ZZZZ